MPNFIAPECSLIVNLYGSYFKCKVCGKKVKTGNSILNPSVDYLLGNKLYSTCTAPCMDLLKLCIFSFRPSKIITSEEMLLMIEEYLSKAS